VSISGRFSSLRSRGSSDEAAATGAGSAADSPPAGSEDELVQLIADRVYQCLMQDLRIERERLRLVSKRTFFHKGGR
jgi:hypothetical protein